MIRALILQVESREEIFADKLIAFAFRPNRIKYRDLWDIAWLHGQGVKPRLELIPVKLNDRQHTLEHFVGVYQQRLSALKTQSNIEAEFQKEMRRFLPLEQVETSLNQEFFWSFIINLIETFQQKFSQG